MIALASAAPLLRRSPTEIQIGLDPGPVLVLSGVSSAWDPVLHHLLDGCPDDLLLASVARRHLDASVLLRCRQAIGRAGLLAGPRVQPPGEADTAPPRSRIRLVGAGLVGRAIGRRLASTGELLLEIVDSRPVDPLLYPGGLLEPTQADALARELSNPPTAAWTSTQQGPPALVVLAADTWEPDASVTDALVRTDQPHLVVRPWLGGVQVGPLVVPGRTPCLRCLDRTRTGEDAAWPTLRDQLVRRPAACEPAVLDWAASVTTLQVRAWLADRRSELIGATAVTTPPDYHLHTRAWRIHPGCGCDWNRTAR